MGAEGHVPRGLAVVQALARLEPLPVRVDEGQGGHRRPEDRSGQVGQRVVDGVRPRIEDVEGAEGGDALGLVRRQGGCGHRRLLSGWWAGRDGGPVRMVGCTAAPDPGRRRRMRRRRPEASSGSVRKPRREGGHSATRRRRRRRVWPRRCLSAPVRPSSAQGLTEAEARRRNPTRADECWLADRRDRGLTGAASRPVMRRRACTPVPIRARRRTPLAGMPTRSPRRRTDAPRRWPCGRSSASRRFCGGGASAWCGWPCDDRATHAPKLPNSGSPLRDSAHLITFYGEGLRRGAHTGIRIPPPRRRGGLVVRWGSAWESRRPSSACSCSPSRCRWASSA